MSSFGIESAIYPFFNICIIYDNKSGNCLIFSSLYLEAISFNKQSFNKPYNSSILGILIQVIV